MTTKHQLTTGSLTIDQIDAILGSLPGELTFIDDGDVTRFFTQGNDVVVFERKPEILGQDIRDCHSEASIPAIEKMLAEFRSGAADKIEQTAEKDDGSKILVRYLAVRDGAGTYLGCIEWVEEIADQE